MTKHLYYEDSYLTEFAANLVEHRLVEGKPAAVLDRTAFYPTSGGQPCDAGWLEGIRVESVEEDDSGIIVHMLAGPLGSSTAAVRGKVDWERRFDHMQQHTGQHILSQAFVAVAQAGTLSFHLGQEISTIDVDLAQPEASLLRTVEDLANRIVFEDRPVRTLNVTRQELDSLGIRKETQREGEIRVIEVENFDRSACGGTHVRRCGEIGLIMILGGERYKGGTRIEFVCGGRALHSFRKDHETIRSLGKLFSAHPHELPELCEKFLAERAALVREKKRLEEDILALEAQELIHGAEKINGLLAVRRNYGDRKIESLKILAQKVTAAPGMLAILSTVQDTAQLVVARSQDLAGDCGAAIKQMAAKLGGRGGGRPELAQAGSIAASALDEWVQGIVDLFKR
jgi:alanyl-tRNA synthetase